MKLFGRIVGIVERIACIAGYLSGWLVPLMMMLVLVEVFTRYVLNKPIILADEFAAYMLVALAFLGAAYTWKEKGHVRITALVSRLPARVASWVRLISLVLAFVFAVALSQSGYNFMAFSFRFHVSSSSWLHTPLQVPQMTILIGFVLLLLLIIVDIGKAIVKIRSGGSVEEATR